MFRYVLLLGAALLTAGCADLIKDCDPEKAAREELRIVAAHPTVVQLVYALGVQDKLVGRDQSSTYPEGVEKVPSIKYMRTLSDEGILSLNPTLLLLTPENGPAPVINKLEKACLKVAILKNDMSRQALLDKIKAVGDLVQQPERATKLVAELQADFRKLDSLQRACTAMPTVLSFHSRGKGGALYINGMGTPLEYILSELKARPALEVEGVKEVNKESLMAANPDYILIDTKTAENAGGVEALKENELLKNSPAVKNNRIILVHGVHLFGPNAEYGKLLTGLIRQLHPELSATKR